MATVSLKNVMKIYPHGADQAKPKKAKKNAAPNPEEEKVNLQITEKGVVAVQQFSLGFRDIGRFAAARHGLLITRVAEIRERTRTYAILDASTAQNVALVGQRLSIDSFTAVVRDHYENIADVLIYRSSDSQVIETATGSSDTSTRTVAFPMSGAYA